MNRRIVTGVSMALSHAAMAILLMGPALAADVPRMTKEELKSKLGDPSVVILDLRVERDWKSSDLKILGAIRENPTDADFWAPKYPKEKTLVLYCA